MAGWLNLLASVQARGSGRGGRAGAAFTSAGFDVSVWELLVAAGAGGGAWWWRRGRAADPVASWRGCSGGGGVARVQLRAGDAGRRWRAGGAVAARRRVLVSAGRRWRGAVRGWLRRAAGRRLVNLYGPTETSVC